MEINWQKLCAMGCSILYVILFLFCPFLVVRFEGIGASGKDLLSVMEYIGIWPLLPLLSGIAMAICSLVTPGKVGGIICCVGTVMPLITYYLLQGSISGAAGNYGSYFGSLSSMFITMGAGVILPMIFGAGAAVLCFLSGIQARPKTRSAGYSAGEDDEW